MLTCPGRPRGPGEKGWRRDRGMYKGLPGPLLSAAPGQADLGTGRRLGRLQEVHQRAHAGSDSGSDTDVKCHTFGLAASADLAAGRLDSRPLTRPTEAPNSVPRPRSRWRDRAEALAQAGRRIEPLLRSHWCYGDLGAPLGRCCRQSDCYARGGSAGVSCVRRLTPHRAILHSQHQHARKTDPAEKAPHDELRSTGGG